MTQISFLELFAGWSPELCVFAGLFGFMLFAMAAITLITAPAAPRGRTPSRPSRSTALLDGVR